MMKKSFILFILFCMGATELTVKNLDPLDAIEENLLLEAELELAKNPKPYFLFNLKDKMIKLKIRGMTLNEWEVETIRFWGDPLPPKPIPLIEKTTMFPPTRKHIKPSKGKDQTNTRFDALEVDDMPDRYTLFLDERIRLYIRPKATGILSIFKNLGDSMDWFTTPPILALWYALSKKSFTAIFIVLKNQQAAKSLYWIFSEGTNCILLPQKHLLRPPSITKIH